jgi:hypothetical protein
MFARLTPGVPECEMSRTVDAVVTWLPPKFPFAV